MKEIGLHTLKVNEIFYSIQGEGGNVGRAANFIRLSGCNLKCSFCDTDHSEFSLKTLQEIKSILLPVPIIWTGGEPCLQLSNEIVEYFKPFKQWIETNGTLPIPAGLDYITVSPKDGQEVLNHEHINELRVPVIDHKTKHIGHIKSDSYFFSPVFDNNFKQNLSWATHLVMSNPKWRLSVQIHKLVDGIK